MACARETWTDERLTDLADRTDAGFARVDTGLRDLRANMDAGFGRVGTDIRDLRANMDVRFERVDAQFERVDARFDALQHLLIRVSAAGFVSLFVALLALVGARLV